MSLLPILATQLFDYNNYEQGLLKIIGYPGYPDSDCKVCDMMSYSEWIGTYHKYPTIKIEGIDSLDEVQNYFKKASIKNIHLFVSQRYGYSFNWHQDNVNVLLYVLKGKKTVHIRDTVSTLYSGQHAIIPNGHLHRVSSIADTWALSIGY
jgi:mannose-6-phosphate isomerase-like protein (cupin superfamily)